MLNIQCNQGMLKAIPTGTRTITVWSEFPSWLAWTFPDSLISRYHASFWISSVVLHSIRIFTPRICCSELFLKARRTSQGVAVDEFQFDRVLRGYPGFPGGGFFHTWDLFFLFLFFLFRPAIKNFKTAHFLINLSLIYSYLACNKRSFEDKFTIT